MYERSCHNLNSIRIWPEKPLFLRGDLGSSSIIFAFRIFNVAQHWYSVGVQHWNNVKSTLYNIDAMVFQRCTTSFQRCFNVDMTLSQHCFNVASTSVKANRNHSGWWKVWVCRKIHKFYSTKWKKNSLQHINYLTINKSLK